ncbi:MAG: NUDIX domain-containing protein [Clostridia bacterium]|jgi:8-oxo-dGTP diphosphatase|nr:NUDIX domain-containing protein [Clostridia bacterium]
MQGYNLIAVYNKECDRLLMCVRKKQPYLGLSNLVGGKIEKGEESLSAAYRELAEETSITKEDIILTRLMDFTYPFDDCYVEVYAGRLNKSVEVCGDENDLYWSTLDCNFFDAGKYAGEGNIGHILMHIEYNKDKVLKI